MLRIDRPSLAQERCATVVARHVLGVSARSPRRATLLGVGPVLAVGARPRTVDFGPAPVGNFKFVGAFAPRACTLFHGNPFAVVHAPGVRSSRGHFCVNRNLSVAPEVPSTGLFLCGASGMVCVAERLEVLVAVVDLWALPVKVMNVGGWENASFWVLAVGMPC